MRPPAITGSDGPFITAKKTLGTDAKRRGEAAKLPQAEAARRRHAALYPTERARGNAAPAGQFPAADAERLAGSRHGLAEPPHVNAVIRFPSHRAPRAIRS